jgi:hypothetical protein
MMHYYYNYTVYKNLTKTIINNLNELESLQPLFSLTCSTAHLHIFDFFFYFFPFSLSYLSFTVLMSELESRTRSALQKFDSNMSGIFDRASFYDSDLYSQATYPELSKSQRCFKYTLLAINTLFLILGAVLIAVGSAAVNSDIGQLAGSTLPTGITVLGIFIVFVALLGTYAAWRESRAVLSIYFIFLLLFTLILFFVSIAVYVERNNSESLIRTGWNAAGPYAQSSLAAIFNCCGFDSFNDTATYISWQAAGLQGCTTIEFQSGRGCLDVMKSNFQSYYETAAACGIIFAFLMMFGVIGVCFLMKAIKQKRNEQDLAKLRSSQATADPQEIQAEPLGTQEEHEEGEEEEEEV